MRTEAIEAAFRATTYRIESAEGFFDLRIGKLNSAFDDFMRRQGVCRWAIITAYNPGGERHDQENARFQAQLLDRVEALGWPFLKSCHLADDAVWPDVPGCLLLQVSETEGSALAADFFQLAWVCGEIGTAARLVWV